MLAPAAAGWSAAGLVAAAWSPVPGWAPRTGRALVVGVAALAVAVGVSRLVRRLLPLAWLLRLETVFPDTAPNRFRLALRVNRTSDLVELANRPGVPADQRQAAERIVVLAAAIHAHDRRTRGHSERVRAYTRVVGEAMGLRGEELDKLSWAGLLHDVGKLVVEPEVLTKPDRLDEHELRQIHQHPVAGFRMAEPLLPWLGRFGEAILHHHERYDGSGYPFGLAGQDISVGGRIVAVADACEAMTAKRTYNTPKTLAEARQELARSAGTHFDPAVVRAFLAVPLRTLSVIALPTAGLSLAGAARAGAGALEPMRVLGDAVGRVGIAGAVAGVGVATVLAIPAAGPATGPTDAAGPGGSSGVAVAGSEPSEVGEPPSTVHPAAGPRPTADASTTAPPSERPTPHPTGTEQAPTADTQPGTASPAVPVHRPAPAPSPPPAPAPPPPTPPPTAAPPTMAPTVTAIIEDVVSGTPPVDAAIPLPEGVSEVSDAVADVGDAVVDVVDDVTELVTDVVAPPPPPPPPAPAPAPAPAAASSPLPVPVEEVLETVGDVVGGILGG